MMLLDADVVCSADTSRPAAKKLEEQGVETVAADMDDADSLRKALQGSFAVFAVTN